MRGHEDILSGIAVARVLLSVVFVLNGLGIIDQTVPLKELMEHGVPVSVAHLLMMAARVLEFAAGLALALGVMPRLASLAPLAFLVPATFVSHSFWQAAGTPAHVGQLINFSKNVAIWGGLVFVASRKGNHFEAQTREAPHRTKLQRFRTTELTMKAMLISFAVGLMVGVAYALLRVKSPAPPLVALLGLLGIVAGEHVIERLLVQRAVDAQISSSSDTHAGTAASVR